MEGMRGFAVFLVFLVHYVSSVQPWIGQHSSSQSLFVALHTVGNAGVDLFFVLSGYLIYGSLISRNQNFLRFVSRRVARIYPTFVAVFVLYLGLSFVFPTESKIPSSFQAGLVYLVENLLLLPGIFRLEPVIAVAWSLSYEMFYYVACPLVITVLGLRSRSSIWRMRLFFFLAVVGIIYFVEYGGHIRLVMFVSGILVYESLKIGRAPIPSSVYAWSALPIGLLGMLLPTAGQVGDAAKVSILFVSLFTVCVSCFGNPVSSIAKTFSWTPLRWLGNMSYSYYLIHGFALKVGFLALSMVSHPGAKGATFFWILLPPMFLLTIVSAIILFLLIERPFSLTPPVQGLKGKEFVKS